MRVTWTREVCSAASALGQPKSTARGGQARFPTAPRINLNPIDLTEIPLQLLREHFRRRIRGVMTPRPQPPIHRSGRRSQPKTSKRHPDHRGDPKKRPPLLGFERYRIDDHRMSRRERIGRLSAQRSVDTPRGPRCIAAAGNRVSGATSNRRLRITSLRKTRAPRSGASAAARVDLPVPLRPPIATKRGDRGRRNRVLRSR